MEIVCDVHGVLMDIITPTFTSVGKAFPQIWPRGVYDIAEVLGYPAPWPNLAPSWFQYCPKYPWADLLVWSLTQFCEKTDLTLVFETEYSLGQDTLLLGTMQWFKQHYPLCNLRVVWPKAYNRESFYIDDGPRRLRIMSKAKIAFAPVLQPWNDATGMHIMQNAEITSIMASIQLWHQKERKDHDNRVTS